MSVLRRQASSSVGISIVGLQRTVVRRFYTGPSENTELSSFASSESIRPTVWKSFSERSVPISSAWPRPPKMAEATTSILGGDGVFGFEFEDETRARMAVAALARFSDPKERERQRGQQKYWTESVRALMAAKIREVHASNPEQARLHSEMPKIRRYGSDRACAHYAAQLFPAALGAASSWQH